MRVCDVNTAILNDLAHIWLHGVLCDNEWMMCFKNICFQIINAMPVYQGWLTNPSGMINCQ